MTGWPLPQGTTDPEVSFVCPECGEPARHLPPVRWVVPGPPPEWSHLDGESLCPIVGQHRYEPADGVPSTWTACTDCGRRTVTYSFGNPDVELCRACCVRRGIW